MKQLNDVDTAYLSGFLERGLALNIYTNPAGLTHIVGHLRRNYDDDVETVLDLLDIEVKCYHQNQSQKIIDCANGRTNIMQSKKTHYYLNRKQLLELLPILTFKNPIKERMRVLIIDGLHIQKELQHYKGHLPSDERKREDKIEGEKQLRAALSMIQIEWDTIYQRRKRRTVKHL